MQKKQDKQSIGVGSLEIWQSANIKFQSWPYMTGLEWTLGKLKILLNLK